MLLSGGSLADEIDFVLAFAIPPRPHGDIIGLLHELPPEILLKGLSRKDVKVLRNHFTQNLEPPEFDELNIAKDVTEPKAEERILNAIGRILCAATRVDRQDPFDKVIVLLEIGDERSEFKGQITLDFTVPCVTRRYRTEN